MGPVRVIKETEKDAILKGCHTDPVSGHQGINRTTSKIRERYYWVGMENDIKDYIRQCDKCQGQNHLSKASAELHPIPVKDKPFDMLGLDLVGPLHKTQGGNRYIAVLTDYFTKWPEVRAIPSKHAEHIVDFIIDVICRHGTPSEIITDRGREFCNKINDELCKKLNITHKVTSPYHPQTNGLTERFNQTLCNALKKYINEQQDDWDCYLQQIAFAARTSHQKSTRQTPSYLVYGRQATLPIQIDIPVQGHHQQVSEEDQLATRIASFTSLIQTHGVVKESIKKSQAKQKMYHDRNNIKPLLPGQLVLVKNTKRENRKGDKMVHTWTGPFTVTDYLGKGVYKVAGRKTVLNIKNLKPYHCSQQTTSTRKQHPTAVPSFQKKRSSRYHIHGHLKRLKIQALVSRRKNSNSAASIKAAKKQARNPFNKWAKNISRSQMESLIQKCSMFDLPQPRLVTKMTTMARSSPTLSLYLKWQKIAPLDLDKCISMLAATPPSTSVNPFKRVPAIMTTSAILMESYSIQLNPTAILPTFKPVPFGYTVESKFKFSQTNPNECLHVADYALTTADLQTLRPKQWLNDQVVDAFLKLSSKESNDQRSPLYSNILPSYLAAQWANGDYNTHLFLKSVEVPNYNTPCL